MSAEEKEKLGTEEQEYDRDSELGPKMSFIEHLEELRYRIIVSVITFAAVFVVVYATPIIDTVAYNFTKPLEKALEGFGKIQYTHMAEGFFFQLKIAALTALFVSLPMIFYQFWAFVAPGLYKKEKIYMGPLILSSTLFFVGGAAFFFLVVFPIVSEFFTSFARPENVEFNPKYSELFTFVMMLIIAFGVVFELPLVVFVLARLRIVNDRFLRKNRKYALLIIVVLGAFFTPPDVVSQMFLVVPMLVLYEISVIIAKIFGPSPPKTEEEKPAEEEKR